MKPGHWTVALAVAILFAGCFGATERSPKEADATEPTIASTAFTSYLHDVSPRIDGITLDDAVQENHRITVEDGSVMDAWTVRPPGNGPFPLVVSATPYYGGGPPIDKEGGFHFLDRWGSELYLRGYAVGILSVRGTGLSEGCFTAAHPIEARDTAISIEQLAALPWSNGNVGMTGASWPGTTPLDVWTEAPPALKAIIPVAGASSAYHHAAFDGVPYRSMGLNYAIEFTTVAVNFPIGLEGGRPADDPVSYAQAQADETCPERRAYADAMAAFEREATQQSELQARDLAAEATASIGQDPATPRAAVFLIHGLNDWLVKPDLALRWLDAVAASGVPTKAWFGQWGHSWPERSTVREFGLRDPASDVCAGDENTPCRDDFWNDAFVAWFDQFLLGKDTGILDAPSLQVQDSLMRWRHDTWPLAATNLTLHPGAGVLTNESSTGTDSYFDYAGRRVGNHTLETVTTPLGPDRARYVSAPLAAPLHVAAAPRLEGRFMADADRAAVVATLVDLGPDGTWSAVGWGARGLQHNEDFTTVEPIAGTWRELTVRFYPLDHVFDEGHQVVLVVAGNAIGIEDAAIGLLRTGPIFEPKSDGATIQVDRSATRLVLQEAHDPVFEAPQPYSLDDAEAPT